MNFGLFMMPLHPPRRSYADPDDHTLVQRSLRLLMEEVAPMVKDLD